MSKLKKYECHKTVHARPMSRGDYNEYRGWTLPPDENFDDPGYLVIYNRNTDDHYESWSPKHVFDDGYTEISEEDASRVGVPSLSDAYMKEMHQDDKLRWRMELVMRYCDIQKMSLKAAAEDFKEAESAVLSTIRAQN